MEWFVNTISSNSGSSSGFKNFTNYKKDGETLLHLMIDLFLTLKLETIDGFLKCVRCFYLAKSYSLAGKRTEAYVLYCHARSLADAALQKLQSGNLTNKV